MGEIGSLISETDSKLIASTLQALKDIVSVEASAGESQFMTGAVETSAFGTFAISTSDEAKLVMSYIISVPSNQTVPEHVENTIQKICTNFGKQLTQVRDIGEMAKQGARIPDHLVNQAFLNAVTVVQLDRNIDKNTKQFQRDIDRIIDEVFIGNKLPEMMETILDDKFVENRDYWYNGFPSKLARSNILQELSNLIIQKLVEKDPMALLNSQNPRSEYKNILPIVQKKLFDEFEKFEDQVSQIFKKEIKEGYKDYLKTLTLYEVHTASTLIYSEFIKRSLIKIAKEKPSVLFYEFTRSDLRRKVEGLLPEQKIENFGDVMIETVTRYAPPRTWNFIRSFYTTLTKEMVGKKFNNSAIDLGLLFAQYFIEPETLKSEIAKNKTMEKQWKTELLSLIPENKITTLEVNSIEEANQLASAAGNTIINVLVEIINYYYVGNEEQTADLLVRFSQFYKDLSSKIKTSHVLLGIFQALENIDADLEFITPGAIDLIGTYMMDKNLSFELNSVKYDTNKKLFGPYFAESKDESVLFVKKLNELDEFDLYIKDQTHHIKLEEFKFSDIPQILLDVSTILDSVAVSGERKIKGILVPALQDYVNSYCQEIDKMYEKAKKDTLSLSKLKKFQFSVKEFSFDRYNFGKFVHTHNLKFVQELKKQIKAVFQEALDEFLSKVNSGSTPPKSAKYLRRPIKDIQKLSRGIIEEYENELIQELNRISSKFNNQKQIIEDSIVSNEILHYSFSSDELVTPLSEMEKQMERYIQDKYGKSIRNDEILRFNLGIKLFDTLSNASFEAAYDQLLSNNLDERLKDIRNTSNNRVEFETQLRDIGRAEAYDLFRAFEDLLNKASEIYINKDGVVSIDSNYLKLHLGRLKLAKYPRRELITNLIKLPNITVDRDGDSWLISYGFTKVSRKDKSIPNIITLKDTAHYLHKLELHEELNDVIVALKEVGKLIEDETYNRLENVKEELFNAIFADH